MIKSDTFGERLKHRRIEMELSQSELGRLTGIAPAQISRYESNVNIPRDDIAAKLAKAVGVSFDWLKWGQAVAIDTYAEDNKNISYSLDMPSELLKQINESSIANNVSLAQEIIDRLESSFLKKKLDDNFEMSQLFTLQVDIASYISAITSFRELKIEILKQQESQNQELIQALFSASTEYEELIATLELQIIHNPSLKTFLEKNNNQVSRSSIFTTLLKKYKIE